MVNTLSFQQKIQNDPIRNQMQRDREVHARRQEHDYSHVFRKKSRFDLIRLSAIIVGIEFAYSAETAFVSPILLEMGIEHKHMTMIFGLSPLFGFFISPLMGSLSDRCHSSFGRRRPLIFLLSIGIFCGLLITPFGKEIGIAISNINYTDYDIHNIIPFNFTGNSTTSDTDYVAFTVSSINWSIILTIIGIILLDFCADNCQTPSRAFLLDVCIPEDHAKALSTFSILAGIGGFFGYSLGGIDWSGTAIGLFVGGSIPTVFLIVTIIFVISVICTITSFREVPLSLMERDEMMRPITQEMIDKVKQTIDNKVFYIKEHIALPLSLLNNSFKNGNDKVIEINNNDKNDDELNNNNNNNNINNNNNNLEMAIIIKRPTQMDSNNNGSTDTITCVAEEPISLLQYLKSIVVMPASLRILCITNLFSWMSHLCYCLYFTDFVGESVFGGNPMAPHGSASYILYEHGVRFGCWGMAIYALSCSIYSMLIVKLIRIFKSKTVYVGGLLIFSIGMIILSYWTTKTAVLLLSVTAGIVYATLFTMPFLLVAQYHAKGCFSMQKGNAVISHNKRGLGTDIAVVGSMLFVAQLIVSMSVGYLIVLLGSTRAIIYAASFTSFLAAIAATKVVYMDL